MIKPKNTFGDYEFPKWVPQEQKDLIKDFWGVFGRTHKDWLESHKAEIRKNCMDGFNGANGFGLPEMGAKCRFFTKDYFLSDFDVVEGRFLFRWNNIGSVIDDSGVAHHVSSILKWELIDND